MRKLVVSASDEAFMPLLRGLLASLLACRPQPFDGLAVLDVGLAPASRRWLEQQAVLVVEPPWDLPVPLDLRAAKPHLRALTARPHLPRHLPGWDLYLWMDADAWVQQPWALAGYFAAAATGALAAAPEVDRAYRQTPALLQWRLQHLRAGHGEPAAQRALWATYVNAGVFALHAQAPHWAAWARHYEAALIAGGAEATSDQSALNHALWSEPLPLHPLPATFNWLCHLATPLFDAQRGVFVEPFAPRQVLGIVHLAGEGKDGQAPVLGEPGRLVSLRHAAA